MYNTPIIYDEWLDLMTTLEFKHFATYGATDYDGFGYPVRDGMEDTSIRIYPSELKKIPNDATHISWYNK